MLETVQGWGEALAALHHRIASGHCRPSTSLKTSLTPTGNAGLARARVPGGHAHPEPTRRGSSVDDRYPSLTIRSSCPLIEDKVDRLSNRLTRKRKGNAGDPK